MESDIVLKQNGKYWQVVVYGKDSWIPHYKFPYEYMNLDCAIQLATTEAKKTGARFSGWANDVFPDRFKDVLFVGDKK